MMDILYACGCSVRSETVDTYCKKHGRHWLVYGSAGRRKIQSHIAKHKSVYLCPMSKLDLSLDEYDLVFVESNSEYVENLKHVPIVVDSTLSAGPSILSNLVMRNDLCSARLALNCTDTDVGWHHYYYSNLFVFNSDVVIPKLPYRGPHGTLHRYLLTKIKPKSILHLGAKSAALAKVCLDSGVQYTVQTVHPNLYNLIVDEDRLKTMTISEQGSFA